MVLEAWGRDVYSAGDGCYLGMQGLWSPDGCSHSGIDSEVEAIERHFVKGLELFRSDSLVSLCIGAYVRQRAR